MDRPLVTEEEFAALECNRCGECCEGFFFQTPIGLADLIGRHAIWEKYRKAGGEYLGFETMEQEIRWYSHFEPLEGQLAPRRSAENTFRYRCDRFARDADGVGICTAYADRPRTCIDFPYGKPIHGFDNCVWAVDISDRPIVTVAAL